MVLHTICIDNGDTLPLKLDVTIDPSTCQKRNREHIRDILMMKSSAKTLDPVKNEATKVRNAIKKKLWSELEITRKD